MKNQEMTSQTIVISPLTLAVAVWVQLYWASECPDVKNYKWLLNRIWHRMLYTCTHTATASVKGLCTTRRRGNRYTRVRTYQQIFFIHCNQIRPKNKSIFRLDGRLNTILGNFGTLGTAFTSRGAARTFLFVTELQLIVAITRVAELFGIKQINSC